MERIGQAGLWRDGMRVGGKVWTMCIEWVLYHLARMKVMFTVMPTLGGHVRLRVVVSNCCDGHQG